MAIYCPALGLDLFPRDNVYINDAQHTRPCIGMAITFTISFPLKLEMF